MAEWLIPALIILVLVVLNGLFVAAEFAILAAPRARMERLGRLSGGPAAQVHAVQSDQRKQDRYIATAQIGITGASLGLGMYGEHHIAVWLEPLLHRIGVFHPAAIHSASAVCALMVLTSLHVILGEMIPKSLALYAPEKAAVTVIRPMLWARILGFPLVWLLGSIGYALLRLLKIPVVSEAANVHSPEELEMIVEESHETGVLSVEESEIFVNLLHFSDLQVRKVMVPRTKVVGVEHDTSIGEAIDIVVESRHTRYPVCRDGLDHILGILHVKELFKEIQTHPEDPRIDRALRPALFVPEQMTVEDLLVEFRKNRSQIAVAIDEYGGTAGIVSLEDVLEEIFGEVQDEFDEETPVFQKIDAHSAVMEGRLRLDEFSEEFGVDLERPDVDTIGGLVLAELGHPPALGDFVEVDGVQLTVTRLDGLGVGRVYVIFPNPLPGSDEP
ncbi:MAG: hemolysin family protein [Armatimonadota bacterium]